MFYCIYWQYDLMKKVIMWGYLVTQILDNSNPINQNYRNYDEGY
jgi:hypothetical protein